MLFRAMCYQLLDHHYSRGEGECFVFLEAPSRVDAAAKLAGLLASIWMVPVDQVEFHTLLSEHELFEGAYGDSHTGDLRLIECGASGDAIHYLPLAGDAEGVYHPPLLLVGQANRRRLLLTLAAAADAGAGVR